MDNYIPDPNDSLTASTYRGAAYNELHGDDETEAKAQADKMALALERFRLGHDAIDKQLAREKDDLKFQVAELQWPAEAIAQRSASQDATIANVPIPGRPMLSLVTLNEPVQLVLNQEKRSRLGVEVHPIDEAADDDTAAVIQGIYRNIEQSSRANIARSWGFNRAVKSGRGVYRVNREYDPYGGHPLDQRIVISRVLYQESVVFDPAAQQPDSSDGEWAFVTQDIRFSKYKQLYPNAKLSAYSDGELTTRGAEVPGWVSGDSQDARTVRIAEYWRVVVDRVRLVLLDDGSVAPDSEIPEGRVARIGAGARSRIQEKRRVLWSVIDCLEELEPEQEWDGQYIPLIPVIGQELIPFDNERRWEGMIHSAKDSARLVNYAGSTAVEMAALEPKAPYLGEEGVFDGHEKEWAQANTRNWPYLEYNRIGRSGLPADKPARSQVDTGRLGPSMQLLSMGRDFVQSATSTYDPALGKQPTAHRSGVAIGKLQDQTVEGTSQYLDNLRDISMTYEAMVILDLIPSTYDRPGRVAQILDTHDKNRTVMLNQPFVVNPRARRPTPYNGPDGEQRAENPDDTAVAKYDLAKGRYGVIVNIGKSHKSRLDEGADEMGRILEADPQMMPMVGPEYFKFRDFPGHERIADILSKMRQHQFPWLDTGEQPNAAMQLQQAQAAMKEMQQKLEEFGRALETDKIKADADLERVRLKFEFDMELQRMKDATAIRIREIDLQIKGIENGHAAAHERIALGEQRAHDVGMAAMQASSQAATAGTQHAHDDVAADAQRAHEAEAAAAAAQAAAPPAAPAPEQV